jgi:DNA ligase-associated metallophosphoesterase
MIQDGSALLPITVAGERLWLHPDRAIWWEREKWLVVSDLHLGKAAHFRRSGLALPEGHDESTLLRLTGLIQELDPAHVLILGDLFHSSYNNRWRFFESWALAQNVPLHLVAGNHDILSSEHYAAAGLTVSTGALQQGPFLWSHQPMVSDDLYCIAGHVHPGIRLQGFARQSLRLPCFLFGERSALMPAFGTATGLQLLQPEKGTTAFCCTSTSVHAVAGR